MSITKAEAGELGAGGEWLRKVSYDSNKSSLEVTLKGVTIAGTDSDLDWLIKALIDVKTATGGITSALREHKMRARV